MIQSAKQLTREVDEACGFVIDTPPVDLLLSCQPCAPQSTTNVATKKLTTRRTKCKARGMSNNHISENAYLEITADAPHGLRLSCSHPECAGSGRRFRYCKGKKFVNVLLFCNARDKATHRCLFFIKQFAMYQSQGETSSSDMDTD